MPKRTAVIDIGSNSARLVIYQRTSRYGFHLITQQKSRVRIGEGAYRQEGRLQSAGVRRAFGALESFAHTLKEYKVHKIHCVATSALRDAPNRSAFLRMVREKLGLDIRIIDGLKEARYGALAAANLLPVGDAVTVDIGGGSADLALLERGRIVAAHSLDLGTVRLKELFSDRGLPVHEAKQFIREALQKLPPQFHGELVVGIGGTARSLAKALMQQNRYPFDKLHAYRYRLKDAKEFFQRIVHSERPEELEELGIKSNRFDTIREGALIFREILRHLKAKEVITSGVGVREGVFLHDLLRNDGGRFPEGVNPSVRSILDRFDLLGLPQGNKLSIGRALYSLLRDRFLSDEDRDLFPELSTALRLCNIGKMLTIYKEHQHAFYIAMQELNYGFTHEQMTLIALIMRSKGDSLYYKPLYRRYKSLLPGKRTVKWLSFLYTLTLILHENSSQAQFRFELDGASTLIIRSDRPLYLAHEELASVQKPDDLELVLHDGWQERSHEEFRI